jgi:transcriptional regulator of heat shock response
VIVILKTKKKVEIHEINGWENIFQNKIIIETNKSHKHSLIKNVNEVEKYDLTYKHYYQSGVHFTSLNHYGTLKVK